MAKTRANAHSSKQSGLNDGLKANKFKKKSLVRGIKNPFSAAKLQSKSEKEKNADLKATEELLKLCRPISINLTRISPEQTMLIPNVDRKFSFIVYCMHIFLFVKSKTFEKLSIHVQLRDHWSYLYRLFVHQPHGPREMVLMQVTNRIMRQPPMH